MIRRGMWVGAALVAGVLVSTVARAADSAPPASSAPATHTDVEPPNGVPFHFRTGFYTEVQIGFFTTFGGEKGFANGQVYEALSAGYEFQLATAGAWRPQITPFLTLAHGPNAGSCRYLTTMGCDTGTTSVDSSIVTAPENFSTFPIEVGVRAGANNLATRLFPYGVLTVGYTLFSPQLDPPNSTNFPNASGSPSGGVHIGVGAGVQYGTRLDGLSIGFEMLFRYAMIPGGLPSLAIYPRLAYVF